MGGGSSGQWWAIQSAWNSWNVTPIVQRWVTEGLPNYGFLVEEQNGINQRFAATTNRDRTIRPKLEIRVTPTNPSMKNRLP